MTTEERLTRTEANLEKLTGVVAALASSVVSHDNQIDALLTIAEKQTAETAALKATIEALTREWQAYLRTIRPQ